jgi:hypothetical protein
VGVGLTTIERLEAWREAGIITPEQQSVLSAIVRRERFSLYVELHALLYVGVVSLVAGIAWTFRDYVTSLGDAAILSILGLLMAASFGYCFVKAPKYANAEVESPSFAFDYILYFGCLVLSAALAFVETRFAIFQGWSPHLLIAAIAYGVLAYRFDNRFVLSLALSTLAGYLGLRFAFFDTFNTDTLRLLGFLYGAFLIGIGWLTTRAGIKPHFLDVYLQLGANAALLAALSGVFDDQFNAVLMLVLLIAAGAAIALGIRFRRFAFVAYGTLYGYLGISVRILDAVGDFTGVLLYVVVSGALVVYALVVIARRFGRDA